MRTIAALLLLSTPILSADLSKLTGVWKADLQKSKIAGPPPANYLVLIEEKKAIFNNRTKEEALQITETTAIWGQRGEQRSVLTVFDTPKSLVRYYQGVPTRLTTSSSGDLFTVTGEVAGRPSTFKRSYGLSPDGNTLTLNIAGKNADHEMQSTVVLTKQADSEAAPLRKPEEIAETHFKNVKTSLKTLPASEFLNQMRYFAYALNQDCEFCHVPRKFDLDDKDEKKTARKMIEMTAGINERTFENHPAVRCFTCHEGHSEPLSRPQFPEEIAAAQAEAAKAEAAKAEAAKSEKH